jgi:hypothetical protein
MKKLITSIMFLLLVAGCFCQKTITTSEEYLKKSQKNKTLAWVMVGGGVLLGVIGAVIAVGDVGSSLSGGEPSNDGTIIFAVGGAVILGSIPFFISGGINKRKAMNASTGFKMQKMHIPNAATDLQAFPAVSIKLNF